MSLVGTFESSDKRFKLNITKSVDANGTFSGTLEDSEGPFGLVSIPISGQYNRKKENEPLIALSFSGFQWHESNSDATGWSGYTNDASPDSLKLTGTVTYVYTNTLDAEAIELDLFLRA